MKKTRIKIILFILSILLIFPYDSVSAQSIIDENIKMEGMSKKSFSELSIQLKTLQVAREINNYIKKHPNMTVEDLQNDEDFRAIAVQKIDKNGYTATTDYDTLINRFHKDPEIEDLDLHNLADKLPGFWAIMSKSKGGVEVGGVYDWEENKEIKKKYMYIAVVETRTADGVGLNVAATTYLDDYNEKSTIDVKDSFNEAQDAIKQRAMDIAKQIEIYIEANSEKTLEDLKNDPKFQDIAVQQVGDTGYTYVIDHETGILDFHPDSGIRDGSYNAFKKEFPIIWGIIDRSIQSEPCEASDGFYEWRDIEDKIRDKYTYHHCIPAKTADGHSFFIGASTYLDEYEQKSVNKVIAENVFQKTILQDVQLAKIVFNDIKERDIKIMEDRMSQFMKNKECKEYFLAGDRDALFDCTLQTFNRNKDNFNITNLSYYKPDGEVFLRMHDKDRFGDNENKIVFNKSKKEQSWGAGFEIEDASLMLNLVHPCYDDNNELIAYIGFGQETDNFIKNAKDETDFDYDIVIKKEYINEKDWIERKKEKRLSGSYDDMDNFVVLDSTKKEGYFLNESFFDERHFEATTNDGYIFNQFRVGEENFVDVRFSLYDAADNKIGVIAVTQNISHLFPSDEKVIEKEKNKLNIFSIVVALFFIILLILLIKFGFSNISIGKKFGLLSLLITALFVSIIYINYSNINQINKEFNQLKDNITPSIFLVNEIEKNIVELKNWTMTYTVKGNIKENDKMISEYIYGNIENLFNNIKKYKNSVNSPEDKKNIEVLNRKLNDVVKITQSIKLLKDGGIEGYELLDKIGKEYNSLYIPFLEDINKHKNKNKIALEKYNNLILESHKEAKNRILIFGLASLLVLLIINFYVLHSIDD